MSARQWPVHRRWLYALKPASWAKLLVPMILGQALGARHAGRIDGEALVWGLGFTIADLTFIVLLNDWADRDVDALKRRMFPDGCSPKTIPDGILPAPALLLGGVAAGAVAVLLAGLAERALGRPWLTVAAILLLGIFAAYTLPPLRLNYRGGGELLEMVGVGVALPLFQGYLQAGELPATSLAILPGFAALSLASAVASGLADEQSDRAGGKRTVVSTWGNPWGRRLVEASVTAGVVLWLLAPLTGLVAALPAWGGASVAWWYRRRLRRSSEAARTNAFTAQKVYKGHLHHAIWRGATVVALLVVAGLVV